MKKCTCHRTDAKALLELEQQHVVYAKPKSGYYIVDYYQTPSPIKDHIDFIC